MLSHSESRTAMLRHRTSRLLAAQIALSPKFRWHQCSDRLSRQLTSSAAALEPAVASHPVDLVAPTSPPATAATTIPSSGATKQVVDFTTLAACCAELRRSWVPAKVEQVSKRALRPWPIHSPMHRTTPCTRVGEGELTGDVRRMWPDLCAPSAYSTIPQGLLLPLSPTLSPHPSPRW